MSINPVPAAAATEPAEAIVVPMFVCAGCRPESLGYAMIELGDALEELALCPLREVCTWHAAHDLGGRTAFNEQPDGSILPALFRNDPYFSCPNFHDYAKFLAGSAVAPVVAAVDADGVAERADAVSAKCATRRS